MRAQAPLALRAVRDSRGGCRYMSNGGTPHVLSIDSLCLDE